MLHYLPSFWYQTQIFEKKYSLFPLSFEEAFGSSSLEREGERPKTKEGTFSYKKRAADLALSR